MSSLASRSKRGAGDQKSGTTTRQESSPRAFGLRQMGVAAAIAVALLFAAQFFYLVPDSAGHVAWVRSLIWDRDVDFANEFARYGMIDREGTILFGAVTPAGRPGNPFGLGSAIVWAPSVLVAAIVARVAAACGVAAATDGFGTATLFAVHAGTWTAGIAALLCMAAALGELLPETGRRTRWLALASAALGTPFAPYFLQLPSYSHVCSALAVALPLWLGSRWRTAWSVRRAAVLGGAVGFAGLVRAQDLAFAILPLGLAAWGGAVRRGRGGGAVAVYVTAALAAFAPQLLAWKAIYGSAWNLPQGAGFLHLSLPGMLGVVLSSRHGLLAWSPVVGLALAGLILLVREPSRRGLGLVLLACFGLQWVLAGLPTDWWAGWSFGARRFVDCTPLWVVGLAVLASRWRPGRGLMVALVLGAMVIWLRVATRGLSGEADPGWNALWGGGFWSALPHLPLMIFRWLATPWTELQVIRRPQSTAPDFASDPGWLLLLILAVWCGLLAVAGWSWRRRHPLRGG